MSTPTLEHFKRAIPEKLRAILRREIVSSKCGEYTVERTMSGILMSSAFAQEVSRLMLDLAEARAQVENARKQAFTEAMDELDKLRTLAATDFKSPNCQGQRGVDRTDAFFDAYHAIRKLSLTSTVSPAEQVCAGGIDPGFDECPKCGATMDDNCKLSSTIRGGE